MKLQEITSEIFDEELENQVSRMDSSQILSIPGIYEILAEELNNSVLAALETVPAPMPDWNDMSLDEKKAITQTAGAPYFYTEYDWKWDDFTEQTRKDLIAAYQKNMSEKD